MKWPTREQLSQLLAMKLRYAVGGGIATAVDYAIYFSLVDKVLPPLGAQAIAFPTSVMVNFLIQRYFVFQLNRKVQSALAMSLLVSAGGFLLSMGLIKLFNWNDFLRQHQLIVKVMTSGLVFFYNFYCKRYVFEKRFI